MHFSSGAELCLIFVQMLLEIFFEGCIVVWSGNRVSTIASLNIKHSPVPVDASEDQGIQLHRGSQVDRLPSPSIDIGTAQNWVGVVAPNGAVGCTHPVTGKYVHLNHNLAFQTYLYRIWKMVRYQVRRTVSGDLREGR
jgi:hypothetical protein